MRLPSVKAIENVLQTSKEDAKKIREILEDFRDRFQFRPVIPKRTLGKISDILGYHGYEHIPQGRNSRSPAIHYANSGDTYSPTILYFNGNFSVGNWGDIVERGNYQ